MIDLRETCKEYTNQCDRLFLNKHSCAICNLTRSQKRFSEIYSELSSDGVFNEMDKLTEKFIKDIAEKRETLIRGRLEELNIDFDIKEEQRRVFKRFATVRNGNEETILFNDGSIGGQRIITFVTKETTNIKLDAEKFSIGYETSYY